MKKRFFPSFMLVVLLFAVISWGHDKPLTLFDTKWKLEGFFNSETNNLEKPDYNCYSSYCFDNDLRYTLEFFSKDVVPENPPDIDIPDGYVPQNLCRGFMTEYAFAGGYYADYIHSTLSGVGALKVPEKDSDDGERFYNAWVHSYAFELTKNHLKLYFVPFGYDSSTYDSTKMDYLLFKPWIPKTSITTRDRTIPQPAFAPPPEEASVVAPASVDLVNASTTAAPNPVSRSAGLVNFYREGKHVSPATLKVFDAMGRFVRKIQISDNTIGNQSSRLVGSWDLRDAKGKLVPGGTYLVRGTVKAADGKRERVSVMVGVR
jgi:hypothetical protein